MSTSATEVDFDAGDGRPDETVVDGIGVAPGIAIGTMHRYQVARPEVTRTHVEAEAVDDELALLDDALDRAEQELDRVRSVARERLGADETAILAAQEMMLRDDEVLGPVRQRIRDEHESAAHALSNVLRGHRRRIETSDDEYLRERATELEELETRLLQFLQRGKTAATIQPNSIIVADRLTAADLIRFQRHDMLGCVTARGGETSHVSIVARALNLPAVAGAEGILDAVEDHDPVILDGRRGRIIIQPRADTLEQYREQRTRHRSLIEKAEAAPVTTTDDCQVTLRANVDFGETLDALDTYGAEGIGLMRTEVLFLSGREESLREQRQYEVYRKAAEASGTHGATIRLLDLGGDKMLPFPHEEENPFLGWRGIRVLLDREDDLLRPQLRALLRANAHGTVRVLVPMPTHLDELHRVRTIVTEEAERLGTEDYSHDADLPVGVLVEVPAVALQAPQFAEAADFLSIGSNDLTQYVLAVDRGNDRVADRYDALHPAVLGLVKRVVEAGRAADTPVSLCGEVGGDVHALPVLLGLGVETISVSPPYLPTVKHVVGATNVADAQTLAAEALDAPDAGNVRHRARAWCDEHYEADLFAPSEEL
ncbi:MAG: phosphoenolpyruvate--protein phosphotransferase [Bacteroidetes bacterium SW_9_63_38]|nr:MAG: phosphoenolpyruvate--protein phosphotransferase [Bacteroidetes bacterium SW_9_63_38]